MHFLRTVFLGASLGLIIVLGLKATGCTPRPEPQAPPGYKENPY